MMCSKKIDDSPEIYRNTPMGYHAPFSPNGFNKQAIRDIAKIYQK